MRPLPIVLSYLGIAFLGCHKPSPEGRPVLQLYLPPGGIEVGSPDTSFVVVEFGSFRCPYCRIFHDSLYPLLERDYFAAGRARFRFISIDTAFSFVQLASWVQCRLSGFPATASEAFEIAAAMPDSSAPDSLVLPPMTDEMHQCIADRVLLRRQELARVRPIGIRAVPTFLVGAQAPDHGRIVGWVVEGLRDQQLLEAIREAHALIYDPLHVPKSDTTLR